MSKGKNMRSAKGDGIPPIYTKVSDAKMFQFLGADRKDVFGHTHVSDILWKNTNTWPRYVREMGDMLLRMNVFVHEPRCCGGNPNSLSKLNNCAYRRQGIPRRSNFLGERIY